MSDSTENNPNTGTNGKEQNTLFPVFLKLEKLNLLIVGGGNVGEEKLSAVLNNSPQAKVKLVATEIFPPVRDLLQRNNISFLEKPFTEDDLDGIDLAIVAINDKEISSQIHASCKAKGVLTNVADKPALCDFYLGSIVQKGNLKIAISTNGKSPTISKRVKEVLNEAFPAEIDDLLDNMEKIRNSLKGDFSEKIRQLNTITSSLSAQPQASNKRKNQLTILLYLIMAIALMGVGHLLFSYIFR
ncbi:precorrin-2 dehydrogenase/sirohydrochlorin ferrochelatase family protein [Desertivirga brevis]|uniref:precorrin-2 dehydrogenase/sirohydrochlorin ferrochelatase family protein n=1 Tax=Desertivirga brevis TaxID=2810310 RepID=UPI001A96AFC9|nr:bifunctional precorrin-2 dehydrogenase/sirohydrochlorin ferrochelatase [Pedobacter sp. SYSU D00873]